jgi:hypothetical protein
MPSKALSVTSAQRSADYIGGFGTTRSQRHSAPPVRQEILQLLASGREVAVFIIVPPPLPRLNDALPIDGVAGLEEGLIRSMRPEWNLRSRGRTP